MTYPVDSEHGMRERIKAAEGAIREALEFWGRSEKPPDELRQRLRGFLQEELDAAWRKITLEAEE